MLPEIEAYFNSTTVSPEEISKRVNEIRDSYREQYGSENTWSNYTFTDYRDSMQAVSDQVSDDMRRAAWSKLKESENPLVKYIAENFRSYREQAEEVFKILPATPDELDKLATDQAWCEEWDRFVRQAVAEGVLEPLPDLTEAQEKVLAWMRRSVSASASHRRVLRRHLRDVAAEAEAKATGTVNLVKADTEDEAVAEA